jgi:hypothetical protein
MVVEGSHVEYTEALREGAATELVGHAERSLVTSLQVGSQPREVRFAKFDGFRAHAWAC